MLNKQTTMYKNWEKNRELFGTPKRIGEIYNIFDVEFNSLRKVGDETLEELLELEKDEKILIFK